MQILSLIIGKYGLLVFCLIEDESADVADARRPAGHRPILATPEKINIEPIQRFINLKYIYWYKIYFGHIFLWLKKVESDSKP